MGKESILLGIAGVVIGIAIFWKTGNWLPALAPGLLGAGLIIFYKEEDKIEKRKDK